MFNLPHKSRFTREVPDLSGFNALIITTSYASLDLIDKKTGEVLKKGKKTGVYASEFTEPYYVFRQANMAVDIASIQGGDIPIEKLSLLPFVRTRFDRKFLKDKILQEKVSKSMPLDNIDINKYDIIFLSGGWGASYDLAQSDKLSSKISQAYASKKILAAVCHGPLGFVGAHKPDGSPLIEGVKLTAVTNKQLNELKVGETPLHPETEMVNANADYQCKHGIIDMFKSLVITDDAHLIVTGQNQKSAAETAFRSLQLLQEINDNK